MFDKNLLANRGDHPLLIGAVAKPNCMVVVGNLGGFAPEVRDV
jgi:hypothetical protein